MVQITLSQTAFFLTEDKELITLKLRFKAQFYNACCPLLIWRKSDQKWSDFCVYIMSGSYLQRCEKIPTFVVSRGSLSSPRPTVHQPEQPYSPGVYKPQLRVARKYRAGYG